MGTSYQVFAFRSQALLLISLSVATLYGDGTDNKTALTPKQNIPPDSAGQFVVEEIHHRSDNKNRLVLSLTVTGNGKVQFPFTDSVNNEQRKLIIDEIACSGSMPFAYERRTVMLKDEYFFNVTMAKPNSKPIRFTVALPGTSISHHFNLTRIKTGLTFQYDLQIDNQTALPFENVDILVSDKCLCQNLSLEPGRTAIVPIHNRGIGKTDVFHYEVKQTDFDSFAKSVKIGSPESSQIIVTSNPVVLSKEVWDEIGKVFKIGVVYYELVPATITYRLGAESPDSTYYDSVSISTSDEFKRHSKLEKVKLNGPAVSIKGEVTEVWANASKSDDDTTRSVSIQYRIEQQRRYSIVPGPLVNDRISILILPELRRLDPKSPVAMPYKGALTELPLTMGYSEKFDKKTNDLNALVQLLKAASSPADREHRDQIVKRIGLLIPLAETFTKVSAEMNDRIKKLEGECRALFETGDNELRREKEDLIYRYQELTDTLFDTYNKAALLPLPESD